MKTAGEWEAMVRAFLIKMDYLSATKATDWSMKLWESLFGDFASHPLTNIGAPTTLLGTLFVTFNVAISAVGLAWLSYGVLTSVVGTANDGQALGQRINTVWYPIRVITGISGMTPILLSLVVYKQRVSAWLETIPMLPNERQRLLRELQELPGFGTAASSDWVDLLIETDLTREAIRQDMLVDLSCWDCEAKVVEIMEHHLEQLEA